MATTAIDREDRAQREAGRAMILYLHEAHATEQALVTNLRAHIAMTPSGAGGEEKLVKNAKDEAATEMLEIATYDALEELARAIGDEQTARLAARHREQEERALRELRGHIVELTHAAVLARASGKPSYDWETTGAAQSEPFTGYDDLTARDVATRLRKSDKNTVKTVREYEGRNKRRVEVLETAQRQLSNQKG